MDQRMDVNMFTVGDILRHKNERQIEARLSRIRQDDPASLFGDGFSHYEDVNGRDQWSLEHEAGITFDISARIDPARFDLIVWLYDGGHVLADYTGFSVMAIMQVITKRLEGWINMANEAKRPAVVDVNGSPCIAGDYDGWKHEARETARYQDRQYEAREARIAREARETRPLLGSRFNSFEANEAREAIHEAINEARGQEANEDPHGIKGST